jgi:non-specific protein-tyrosine kinase
MAADDQQSIDLRDYLRPIAARWWLIVLIVAIATAGTYVYYEGKPKKYTANTSLYVKTSPLSGELLGTQALVNTDRDTADQAKLIGSRTVAAQVARLLGYKGNPADLAGRAQVTPAAGSDFIGISATDPSPQRAAALANAFADAFISVRRGAFAAEVARVRAATQRQLELLGKRAADARTRQTLTARLHDLDALAGVPAGSAEQLDRALPPATPSSPHPFRSALFAAAISFSLALILVFLLERIDRRLRRIEDVESTFELPLVAVVPHAREPLASPDGSNVMVPGVFAESFRSLRMNLRLSSIDRPLRTILVTSAVVGEGKSTVVRNLALSYQEAGLRVAAVEADLRRPSLATAFAVDKAPGLTDVVAGASSLDAAVQEVLVKQPEPVEPGGGSPQAEHHGATLTAVETSPNSNVGALAVLTSGPKPPDPPAILASARAQRIVTDLLEAYDLVLIDSPPLLVVSDALGIMPAVDGVVLVTRIGVTTRDAADRALGLLGRVPNVPILGVVVNDLTRRRGLGGHTHGYYGYGYGYD